MSVRVRYFGGISEATGKEEEVLPRFDVLKDLEEYLTVAYGNAILPGLLASSYLVDGLATTDRNQSIERAAVVDVLPPFAGG